MGNRHLAAASDGLPAAPPPVLRLHRTEDLIEAVPYLIGFHPRDSVVLVGIWSGCGPAALSGGRVRITVRLDIADLCADPPPGDGARSDGPFGGSDDGAVRAARAIQRSGADAVVGLVYVDQRADVDAAVEASSRVGAACAEVGLDLGDLVVVPERDPDVADAGPAASRIAAEATYAGLVALDDRRDLAELIAPEAASARNLLHPALDAERLLILGPGADGRRRRRAAIRALFAATRTLAVVDESGLVRFGAALSSIEVRDACWLAAESGRIDGETLWRELGRRLPVPYDVAPMFLFGWQRWRHGDGVLGAMAARRALDGDPSYSAAHLLDTAIADGLDPFRTPRLRKGA